MVQRLPEDDGVPTAPQALEVPEGSDLEQQAQSIRLPVFDSAIARNSATWDQVEGAVFFSRPRWNSDEVSQLVYARYYPELLTAFENAEGQILKSWEGEDVIVGVALTQRFEQRRFGRSKEILRLHSVNNESDPKDIDIAIAVERCERLFINCAEHLQGHDLRICAESVYSVTTNLCALLEKRVQIRRADEEEVDDRALVSEQSRRIEEIRSHYLRAAQRDAQIRYFGGMMIGVVAIIAGGALLSAVDVPGRDLYFDAAFVAGALGAVVSVMSRMMRGDLLLRFETGDWYIRLLGMFRPFLGAIFGCLLYSLLAGGLLAVDPPTTGIAPFFFYIVLAFAAGFSERFAQDMLSVSIKQVEASAAVAGPPPEPSTGGPGTQVAPPRAS